jgi:hypothetical protein
MSFSSRHGSTLAGLFTGLVAFAPLPGCGGAEPSSSTQGGGGTGGAATGGTGGAGSTGGAGGAGGASGPLCVSSKVGLEGVLGDAPFYATYPRTTTRTTGPIFESFFKTEGDVALFGETAFTDGVAVPATGFFRMPTEGPSGGAVFCAGAGSSMTKGTEKRFDLASLSSLGACPGTPVNGQITACLGDSSCVDGNTFEGTLGDVSFDYGAAITGWGGVIDIYQVRLDNGGFVVLDIVQDTVLGGLLFMAPGGPDPGALYCLGSGSMQPGGPAPNAISFSVGGISRLGTCADAAPVEGAVSGCTE